MELAWPGWPEVNGALARKKAAEYRKEIANGGDLITAREARKAAELGAATNTFEILARESIEIRTASARCRPPHHTCRLKVSFFLHTFSKVKN